MQYSDCKCVFDQAVMGVGGAGMVWILDNLVRPVLDKVDATVIYSQDVISGMALTNSRCTECRRK